MKARQTEMYIETRIYNKLDSKIQYHTSEVGYYFKNRHLGLAGVDSEQVYSLASKAIRDLKVWKQMNKLITTNKFYKWI